MPDLGGGAFSGWFELESVSLPGGVTDIDNGFFTGCSALKSIAIPNGVKRIEENAFSGCIALESIILPTGMEYMRVTLYAVNCPALKSIFFSGTEEEWEYLIATGLHQPHLSVTVYFYSAGQPEPEENYWRSDKDGVTPLPW